MKSFTLRKAFSAYGKFQRKTADGDSPLIPTQQRMFNSKQICLEFVSTFAFFYTDCLYYPECFDSCYHCVITFDNKVSISHILNIFNRILSFFSDYTKYFFVLTFCFVAIIGYGLTVTWFLINYNYICNVIKH